MRFKVQVWNLYSAVGLVLRGLGVRGWQWSGWEWKTQGSQIQLFIGGDKALIVWYSDWKKGKYVSVYWKEYHLEYMKGHGLTGNVFPLIYPWVMTGCRLLCEVFYGKE